MIFLRYISLFFFIALSPMLLGEENTVVQEKGSKPAPPYPFVAFSPPKCGTMMLGKVLSMILNKSGSYYLTGMGKDKEAVKLVQSEWDQGRFVVSHHFTYGSIRKLTDKKYRTIFLVRDPRDQLISIMQWLREGQWSWLKVSQIQDVSEQIDELITGSKYGYSAFKNGFESYERALSGYLNSYNVYFAHYEDLVGPQGGGSEERQITEILNIADFLGVKLSYDEAKNIAKDIYGGTGTYRTGQIGNWKHYFSEHHKQLYKSLWSDQLKRLGYEKNSNW